jgi:hypothetical protein
LSTMYMIVPIDSQWQKNFYAFIVKLVVETLVTSRWDTDTPFAPLRQTDFRELCIDAPKP